MTEPKDRLTKLLEAYRLAVENEATDGGKERRELEKQIREHLTPDPATEKAADLWADKVLEASQGPDPATARTWLETALAAEGLTVKTDWSDNEKPPARKWLVEDWLPRGRIGLFTGRGGAGKSRLMLQLAVAVASDAKAKGQTIEDWLPHTSSEPLIGACPAAPETVVIASWEDEPEEANRRRYWMAAQTGGKIPYARAESIGDRLHWLDMRKHGPVWGPDKSVSVLTAAELTRAGTQVREHCEKAGARLLILDPSAAAFAGDENHRALVRQFIASWDAWGQANDCAVVVVAHPSKASKAGSASDNPDSGYSGSTDWFSGSRFVWQLGQEPINKKKSRSNPAPREGYRLTLKKSSYGPSGSGLWLRPGGKRADAWEECGKRQAADALEKALGQEKKEDEEPWEPIE